MHAENLLIDESSDWKSVEDITENLPESDGVPPLALIVETVDTVDLGTLVVASEEEEVLWILDLVAQEKGNSLNGLLTPIDVVSKEQVVCLRWESSVFKNSKQVIVLAMHITTDLDWSLQFEQVWLVEEDLAGLGAEILEVVLREVDLLARLLATNLQEFHNHGVHFVVLDLHA